MRVEPRSLGRGPRWCWLWLMLLCGPAASASERAVEFRVERSGHEYTVDAVDWQELVDRIESRRALGREARRSHGSTEISLESRYEMLQQDRHCAVSGLAVTLGLARHTPQWLPGKAIPERLRLRWERARLALIEHEQGHEAIAERAAERFVDALAELPQADNCLDWRRQVQRVEWRALLWLQVRSESYDRHTRHGANQGAWVQRDRFDRKRVADQPAPGTLAPIH